jgi:cytochrome-b5 reductase
VIKNYPQGVVSSHVHSLKVGDTIDIKGPFVKWDFEQKPLQHLGLVVGGTGITPAVKYIYL